MAGQRRRGFLTASGSNVVLISLNWETKDSTIALSSGWPKERQGQRQRQNQSEGGRECGREREGGREGGGGLDLAEDRRRRLLALQERGREAPALHLALALAVFLSAVTASRSSLPPSLPSSPSLCLPLSRSQHSHYSPSPSLASLSSFLPPSLSLSLPPSLPPLPPLCPLVTAGQGRLSLLAFSTQPIAVHLPASLPDCRLLCFYLDLTGSTFLVANGGAEMGDRCSWR